MSVMGMQRGGTEARPQPRPERPPERPSGADGSGSDDGG
jgi:hypothetical protein